MARYGFERCFTFEVERSQKISINKIFGRSCSAFLFDYSTLEESSASGFYEWQKKGTGAKQPFYFHLKDKEVFGFAGLYEFWLDRETGEQIETCTIITTEANKVLEPVHDRMAVILKTKDYEQWLDAKEKDTNKLQKLLKPFPASQMISYAVSKAVNTPSNDSAELIENSA